MSSSRFRRLLNDASLNNDRSAMIDAYHDWQVGHCYYPTFRKVRDCHTGYMRFIQVPCGHCYHCQETKINEWVTRMYAHAEDFKNVYFVTLTYRPFLHPEAQLDSLMMRKLVDALYHKDSKNQTKHMAFSPCVLVKKHYQNFIKKLRKYSHIDDLTYVVSGEYGKKYGRPHFHLLLFTNHTITKRDIVRAWSVALYYKDGSLTYKTSQVGGRSLYYKIGNVDFNDLVSNGTFNTTAKIKVDGTFMNAANCFSYVCKYVCKRDEANTNRVIMAFNSLYSKQEFIRHYGHPVPVSAYPQYLERLNYPRDSFNIMYNFFKKTCYEKNVFSPSPYMYHEGLQRFHRSSVGGHAFNEELLPTTFAEWLRKYRPFCEFSRATPIGSIYASRHIQEFTQDVYNKPILQDSGFVVPSYFRNKAKNELYGLKKRVKTIQSTYFSMSNLPDLFRRFTKLAENDVPCDYSKVATAGGFSINSLIKNTYELYKDFSTGEQIILTKGHAVHYKYDRHLRKFISTRFVPISEWIRYWLTKMDSEFKRYDAQLVKSKQNIQDIDASFGILLDSGFSHNLLRDNFIMNSKRLRDSEQDIYHAIHASAE